MSNLISWGILIFCCFLLATKTCGLKGSPVILVPGLGGNQIDAKLNRTLTVHSYCLKKIFFFFNVWLNFQLFTPGIIDCWIDNMRLIYNNETRETVSPEGVELRVPAWGDPFVVEHINPIRFSRGFYFKDIGNMLVNDMGYVRNVSLRGAPYDFRKGPAENGEFFVKLKGLVEETYNINNNQSVTLLGHSMGGLMSLIFLQQQSQTWKDKYINSLITLATPWGGAVKALKVFAVGDSLGSPLDERQLKKLLSTFPSFGFLFPSKLFWGDDEVLVETGIKNYTVADLRDFLINTNVSNGWEFQQDNAMYQLNLSPPNVTVHCLYGSELPTVEKMLYKGVDMNSPPQLVTGDGDSAVNLRSLKGCTHWSDKQKQKVHRQAFPGVNHMKILSDKNVLEYIKKSLTVKNNNESTG